MKAASCKSLKGMRWHPLMIRWCVSLYAKSPAAYRQLASSGFLCLPHKSTLSAHMKFTGAGPGVNPDVIDLIIKEIGISQMTEFQKNVALIWDEMKVKAGLSWTGILVKL